MKYRIKEILHSGRKDTRNKPVDSPKFDGMIDSIIKLKYIEDPNMNITEIDNIEDIKQFSLVGWDFLSGNVPYEYWETTAVIAIYLDYNDIYHIETVNTIYKLEKIED